VQATSIRPLSDTARRAYRDAMREALSLGVPPADVALVVDRFRGENPEPDDFRSALMQYVPLATFGEQDSAAGRRSVVLGDVL
jgi:hypothetical protein